MMFSHFLPKLWWSNESMSVCVMCAYMCLIYIVRVYSVKDYEVVRKL